MSARQEVGDYIVISADTVSNHFTHSTQKLAECTAEAEMDADGYCEGSEQIVVQIVSVPTMASIKWSRKK